MVSKYGNIWKWLPIFGGAVFFLLVGNLASAGTRFGGNPPGSLKNSKGDVIGFGIPNNGQFILFDGLTCAGLTDANVKDVYNEPYIIAECAKKTGIPTSQPSPRGPKDYLGPSAPRTGWCSDTRDAAGKIVPPARRQYVIYCSRPNPETFPCDLVFKGTKLRTINVGTATECIDHWK